MILTTFMITRNSKCYVVFKTNSLCYKTAQNCFFTIPFTKVASFICFFFTYKQIKHFLYIDAYIIPGEWLQDMDFITFSFINHWFFIPSISGNLWASSGKSFVIKFSCEPSMGHLWFQTILDQLVSCRLVSITNESKNILRQMSVFPFVWKTLVWPHFYSYFMLCFLEV